MSLAVRFGSEAPDTDRPEAVIGEARHPIEVLEAIWLLMANL